MRHEKRNSQNEPGMCPGINRLTFWCGPQTRSPRLAHIAKGRDVMRATRGWFGLRERTQPFGTKPESVLESIVSRKCARLSRIGCEGVPLWCSRVGFRRRSRSWARNGRAVKALPYGAAGETRKAKFAKRTWNVRRNQ